jgi:hypothetical protein
VSNETIIADLPKYSVSHFIDCKTIARRLGASLIASRNAADHQKEQKHEPTRINNALTHPQIRRHAVRRRVGAGDIGFSHGGGHRYAARRRPEGRQPFAARNRGISEGSSLQDRVVGISCRGAYSRSAECGALDVGYTGDLSFLTVYDTGAPIKAIGGTRSDARTQAILVRQDSPIRRRRI